MTEEQLKQIKNAKSKGQTIGLVQGSWDLFHLGHLRYIKKARELCDFLIIAMDSDEKIRKRKGNSRPIIPENERYEFISLLGIADCVIVKPLNEPKWNLIKTVAPDVLVAIKENYNEEQIKLLEEFCGRVAILPRQSESSTSDKIRKIIISSKYEQSKEVNIKVSHAVEEMKKRINYKNDMPEPIPMLIDYMHNSTDYISPVAACCYWDGEWYFGTNRSDVDIPKYDVENRTELYYSCIEHAEINLLKKLGNVPTLDTPVYTTLFPCDKCMKVLINKGVKEIFYLEDHPERNWSKRSHELAQKHDIKLTQIKTQEIVADRDRIVEPDMLAYKYIYPPNARHQEQLDIMLDLELQDKDPLDPAIIEQEILFMTNYWYVSQNRFPYEGVEAQFLIVARNPVYKKEDLTSEMWVELNNIWHELTRDNNLPGGALCFRFGNPSYSGASLKRLHAHLIIPKKDRKTKFSIGGKSELKEGLTLERKRKDN